MKMYRHGDLLLQEVGEIPASAKEQEHNILAKGEATGHAHRLHSGIILEDEKGNMFVRVPESGTLTHEEHHTITLPAGDYVVIRQREYRPYEQAIEMVRD